MNRVYKAHILYTKERTCFEVMENGYIAVEDGCVAGVAADLQSLGCEGDEIVDFGDRLLIPAMNDMHVHAPQYRNQGIAMDLELLRGYRTTPSLKRRNMRIRPTPSGCTACLSATCGASARCVPVCSRPSIPTARDD